MRQALSQGPFYLRLKPPFFIALLPALLVGCSVVPVELPDDQSAPAEQQWQSVTPAGVSAVGMNTLKADAAGSGWWQQIDDPLLQQLMAMTIANSPNMESARLTYRQAQLAADIAGVENRPSLNLSTSVSRSGSDDSGMATSYNGSLRATWEIDLWGTGASEKRAAQAGIDQANEELRDARISLMAQTAAAYTSLRLAQENLRVAKASVDIRRETYDLARFEYQSGMGTELEVMQAKTLLDNANAELPQYNQAQESAINLLRVLTGGELKALADQLRIQADLPQPPTHLALNLPAETLRQRPDVKAQEYTVIQQAEAVNQARKARFPSFSLTGSLTGSGDSYGDVFDADSLVRSIAASLSYALFDNGVLKNTERRQKITLDQSINTYRLTLLSAQQEVEDALTSLYTAQQQQVSYQQAEDSARLAEELARYQYDAGLLDFTDLLDTQSSLLNAQNAKVQNEGAIFSAWIELYRSAGGGFQGVETTQNLPLSTRTTSTNTINSHTTSADQGE